MSARTPAISDRTLRRELKRNGWIGKQSVDDKQLARAVRSYQRQFGLRVDGWAGPITSRTLTDRFCSVPDMALERGNVRCAWPREQGRAGLKWAIPGKLFTDYRQVVADALDRISDVCGIRYVYTANARTADIVMNMHSDRPGGVLAWSELPCGSPRQLEQSYDGRESWSKELDPPTGTIGAPHVIAHEHGHAAGLPHGGNWLMRPNYDHRAYTFKGWELGEMVSRYGEPQDVPTDPDDPPAGHRKLLITVEGDFSWDVEAIDDSMSDWPWTPGMGAAE